MGVVNVRVVAVVHEWLFEVHKRYALLLSMSSAHMQYPTI